MLKKVAGKPVLPRAAWILESYPPYEQNLTFGVCATSMCQFYYLPVTFRPPGGVYTLPYPTYHKG